MSTLKTDITEQTVPALKVSCHMHLYEISRAPWKIFGRSLIIQNYTISRHQILNQEQLTKRQQSFSWPFYLTLGRWNFTQSIDTTSICWLHKSLHSCTHNLYNNGECLCKAQGIRTTQSTTKSIISSQAM